MPSRQRRNFYPRPPRGGRLQPTLVISSNSGISIHALREEGDSTPTAGCPSRPKFLSTPSARRATVLSMSTMHSHLFLSTPSARRATEVGPLLSACPDNFYPRPPRGGRPGVFERHLRHNGISIHALREEGDDPAAVKSNDNVRFLSTPSARRATPMAGSC